ncbi:hypothetical protein DN540_43845, partial [Burkholderia multivorans]
MRIVVHSFAEASVAQAIAAAATSIVIRVFFFMVRLRSCGEAGAGAASAREVAAAEIVRQFDGVRELVDG